MTHVDSSDRITLHIPHKKVLFFVLALLLHLLLLSLPWKQWMDVDLSTSPPTPVKIMTPQQISKLKQSIREKSLLISKNAPTSATPPKNARYFSDKNRTYDREQQAAQTQVIPQTTPGTFSKPKSAPRSPPRAEVKKAKPSLAHLGIPFHLDRTTQPEAPPKEQQEDTPDLHQPFGGDQSLTENNLPKGAQNFLNTEESVYYSFYSRIYQEVGGLWQKMVADHFRRYQLPAGQYITGITLVVNEQGHLEDLIVEQSSGLSALDEIALKSFRRVGRFPNPPAGLRQEDGLYRTHWSFQVDTSRQGLFQFQRAD